ncbi:MAG: NAD(P)/FAD-dependent oxidoreductase [Sarcina sp.]
MDYDVLVLGGGITGCAVAYELSKYNLNIAVIEKDFDIADDISFVNTAVVYDGSECKNDLMSNLESMGNELLGDIAKKFNVPFSRRATLRIADSENSEKVIEDMYKRSLKRGLKGIRMLNADEARELEPNLKFNFTKVLYSENTGVINPYDLAIAYGEVAFDNGVLFRLEEIVKDIQTVANGFVVTTNKSKINCKFVVNTIPGDNYSVDQDSKITNKDILKNYYLFLNQKKESYSNLIFKIEDENNSISHIPSANGQIVIGINSDKAISFYKSLRKTKALVPDISNSDVNNVFYDDHHKDLIIIDDNEINKGYIKVTGKHYAEVTVAPAIANLICETVVNNLKCSKSKNFIDKRREFYRFRNSSIEEINELISVDNRYGKIICLCNLISEGEIVDCIRRPLGARTVEGVKRRTNATFGKCHGAQCIGKIIDILARELDKKPTDIVEDSKNSKVLGSRIKEFNKV